MPARRAYSDRINHAFAYAAVHHLDQLRKGTRVPYISHPANVALLLARYGCDDDTIVAAILHDVVEDCDADGHTREVHEAQIRDKFGAEALRTVLDVTHATHSERGAELTSPEKKAAYLEHLAVAGERARWVCAADKLHKARAILSDVLRAPDPDAFWGRFNVGRDETVRWYRQVHDRLVAVGFEGAILDELRAAVEDLGAVGAGTAPPPV